MCDIKITKNEIEDSLKAFDSKEIPTKIYVNGYELKKEDIFKDGNYLNSSGAAIYISAEIHDSNDKTIKLKDYIKHLKELGEDYKTMVKPIDIFKNFSVYVVPMVLFGIVSLLIGRGLLPLVLAGLVIGTFIDFFIKK